MKYSFFQVAVAALANASMLESAIADVQGGLIRSHASGQCWQVFVATDSDARNTMIRPRECSMTEPDQHFEYDKTSGLKQIKLVNIPGECVDGDKKFDHLFISPCNNSTNHQWDFYHGHRRSIENGILRSDQDVCASTGTKTGDDKITWAPCDQDVEHFEFFELDPAVIDAASGTLPPIPVEDITLAGTGVSLDTKAPTPAPTLPFDLPPTAVPDVASGGGPSTLAGVASSDGDTQAPHYLPPPIPPVVASSGGDVASSYGAPPLAVVASSGGDPHFKTWSGKNFDFHGACDLVLVDHPGYDKGRGLTIHIRTKQEKWWSFIEAAAIRIGDQTLEVRGADVGEKAQFWINGVRGEDASSSDNPALKWLQEDMGVTIHYKRASEKQHKFRIDLDSAGDAISIGSYKKWVAVNVNTKRVQNFIGATGMMGRYPSGAMVARDGTTRMENDIDAYGNEWQVRASDSFLFSDVGDGVHYPEKCQMPHVASAQRRLGEFVMPLEDAEEACTHVDDESFDQCVFDVLATNDKDMAGAY